MRTSAALALCAAIACAGPAFAAGSQGSVSTQDYLRDLKQACPKTYVKDADGVPQPVENCTRGFSLATSTPATPGAPAKAADKAHHGGRGRTASAGAPRRASLLADLKITFKRGSAELSDEGRANTDHFAEALRDPSVSKLRFEIAGHTDVTGTATRNQELSEARADAVRQRLIDQGVDAARLQAHGYGSSELADPGNPRAAANRRVEARPLS